MVLLDRAQARGGKTHCFLPANRPPGLVDGFADHRCGDAVGMGGVAESKAPLDTTVPAVGPTGLVGQHVDHAIALQLGLEGAAHPAVGAGGDHAVLRLPAGDHAVLHQRGGRTVLDAGTAGYTVGIHEGVTRPRCHHRIKAAASKGQGESTLHFLAGAHTAGADDALGRVKGKVGVGCILFRRQVVAPLAAVALFPQPHGAGHVLQLAVAVGCAGQAVQRVIGDVQLHDVATQAGQVICLGGHLHARLDGGGTGSRVALATGDFHQAQAAGTEGLQGIRRAQPR